MMDKELSKKAEMVWEECGKLDLFDNLDGFKNDIDKFSSLVEPCRKWLSTRNKLQNIKKSEDSYFLKHEVERETGISWMPHSVFILSAYLEGFKLSNSYPRGDVHVVSLNVGAAKTGV
jgi:hypothetical protein